MTIENGAPARPSGSAVLRPLLPWLLLALAASVTAMVLGAGRGDTLVPALAAGLLGVVIVLAGLRVNVPHWGGAGATSEPFAIKAAMACNVWLAALVYGWGAAALFAVYSLSDLVWRHAWQYGLGAALIAAGLALYGRSVDTRKTADLPPLYLTALHGVAVGAGLVYLIGAGKLATKRADWVANDVFLAGGLTIVALCLIVALTQTQTAKPVA